MPYETKPNSGAMFKNDKKTTDSHPNATGKAVVVCPHCAAQSEHWLSAWTKEGAKGKWQSLAFKPVEQKAVVEHGPLGDEPDDIPF